MKKLTTQGSLNRVYQSSKTKKYFGVFLLSLVLSFVLATKQMNAQPFVVGVDAGAPTIQVFDAATWLPTGPLVPLTMAPFTITGAQAVTWNSDDLLFYAIVTTSGPTARHLVTVDPLSGVCTDIGVMNANYSSLTHASPGVLYAMGGSGSGAGFAQCLFSVNMTTAVTTFLGGPYPVGGFGEVIAYNYDDDLIYHWSGDGPSNMETISPVTFLATPVAQSGAIHSEISGAVYVGGGVFKATDLVFQGATAGFSITSAGVVTLVGPVPYRVRGLGYIDPLLPVELSSFVSSISGNEVTLNWSTASETNNSGFDIERTSANGSWSKVGNVTGNGTSSTGHNYSFADRNLNSGIYNYRLKQIDFNGNFEYFNLSNEVIIGIPVQYELSQNYPNPFNPSTKIDYQLPNDGGVDISIYDNSGKEVMIIVNEFKTAGYYSVNLNASSLSSGVYFYKITSGDFSAVKKMMLLK